MTGRHLAIGTAAALAATATSAADVRIEVGEPFPNVVLPAMDDGRPMSINDFRGQKVIL